jgi:dihydropteroate synthase
MVQLVGILNVTPDSFSDGGQFFEPHNAMTRADELFKAGASFVDVGAESTRPNAVPLNDSEEWNRLEPVLKDLLTRYPGKIMLDSYHPETVKRAFDIGPVIINDVTSFNNLAMVAIVGSLKPSSVVISHLPNLPLQEAHRLTPVSTVEEVKRDLLTKAQLLEDNGLMRSQIILDPGIGFGKTMELNEKLLTFADQVPEYDVMIGYSRKRFLGEHRMELLPNLKAGKIAITHGAKYLRVHDVDGHSELLA